MSSSHNPKHDKSRQLLKAACLSHGRDDFTHFIDGASSKQSQELAAYFKDKASSVKNKISSKHAPTASFDFEEQIDVAEADKNGKKSKLEPLRIQASSANRGQAWSLTVRWKTPSDWKKPHPASSREFERQSRWRPSAKYLIGSSNLGNSQRLASANLFSIKELTQTLTEALFSNDTNIGSEAQGLLLIAGATGSAKSQIARGIAHSYLVNQLHAAGKHIKRNLHVLTHEDPIEETLFESYNTVNPKDDFEKSYSRHGVDYTPRQLNFDTWSLAETINAALRQKPALLFVGEARNADDLRSCMEFGGTGHFVIATAHAGSLIESVEKLLEAAKARSPGERALWVPKIFGVVHLKRMSCSPPRQTIDTMYLPETATGILPTVYRRTSQGQQNLVADGLASLLPYCPPTGDRHAGTLGRQYFSRRLCRLEVDGAEFNDDGAEILRSWRSFRFWNARIALPEHSACFPDTGPQERLIDKAHQEDLNGY